MDNDRELSGADIRAIREALGLTQLEAGRLIGGGPRAFSKYEAGAVKPSAAAISLLRVLAANPTAIATLRGNGPGPLSADTPGPFEVTGDHVAALSAWQLPQLLRRLLQAETHAHQLPASGIHVAGNIHAADGGEDGRISWTDGPERTPYLPSRSCQFQLKAGAITPAAAGHDVLTSGGMVKDMVRAGLEAGGHYILLATQRYTQKAINQREARIRDALRNARLTIASGQVQVRDADQIAAWANAHPAVATWLRELTQPGTASPFRSWTHWAGRPEHVGSPWVDDSRLPALRDWLLDRVDDPRSTVRVVGRAGVGKSRLINRALHPAADDASDGSSPTDLVLYGVETEAGPQAIISSVQSLADAGTRAIVVVDHCTHKTHTVLASMVARQSSQLSLVTISDHVPDEAPDPSTYEVREAPADVIEAIISRAIPGLPSEDHRRLVQFARGHPEIAIRVSQSWGETDALARATDDSLVDAYVLGPEPGNRDRLLNAASLLAVFGVIRVDPPKKDQRSAVARLGSVLTEDELRLALDELSRRSVLHQRGGLMTCQPLPIAVELAKRQWRAWSRAQWDAVLTGAGDPTLQVAAARQLALLNEAEVSTRVLRHVCRPDGPFDGLRGITAPGHAHVLSSLAEIDPVFVGNRIKYFLRDVADLKQIEGDARRHLVWATEKIAFRADAFHIGAGLLLRLAAAENETWGNNATGQFAALFPAILANTAADGETRLTFLDAAADTDDADLLGTIVDGLVAGCQTRGFSRTLGPEAHGARPSLQPWVPPDGAAATAYIQGCVERLKGYAAQSSAIGTKARIGLGNHLRSLIGGGLIDTVESATHFVCQRVDVWPEAVESLNHFLRFDAKRSDPAIVDRVRSLATTLEPAGLKSRARFIVTEMPWDYLTDEQHDSDATHERQVKAVQKLASELAAQPQHLIDVLPELSRGAQRMAFAFGVALAGVCAPAGDLLEPMIAALAAVPADNRNLDLLSGYVVARAQADPQTASIIKERFAQSQELAPALPVVCGHLGISRPDVNLVIGAIRRGYIDPSHMRLWRFGGVLAEVEARAVASLLDELLPHSVEGFAVALELMVMYAHGRSAALEDFRPQILRAVKSVIHRKQLRGETRAAHHFERVVTWILSKGRQDPDARTVAFTLSMALVDVDERIDTDVIEPLVPRLLADYPEISWPLIGQAIVADRSRGGRLRFVLGSSLSPNRQDRPAILHLPEDVLFAWCHAHPERAPQFAATVVPFLAPTGSTSALSRLHPVMARLLDAFGDRQPVLDAISMNIRTFGWTGSVATYYSRYEEPLQALFDHRQAKVRLWAQQVLRQVHEAMDSYRREDEEFEAHGELYG